MEFLGKVFETVKNIAEIVENVKDWYGYHSRLEESMQNLKRKMEDLSAQENDVNKKISSEEHRVRKKRKAEVVVWLRDEQDMKNDVQRLEQEVVGERNLISRVQLGKRIIEKIQEVEKLQEKGRAFDSLLVDDFSGLLMPPTKDFVESTEARNLDRVWECLMNEDVRQIGVYGMGGVGKTTIMKQINNRILKETGKFDIVYWVTISQAFNISKLQSNIAKKDGLQSYQSGASHGARSTDSISQKAVRNEVELAPNVKPIAAKIAKKCARLPLAIITVAGSLRRLEGIHEWRDAFNEFTNLMNEVSGGGREVFEQLKFSYSRLGDKVVQDCFLYCSLYPEDHEIYVDDLIELWMAEGLIPEMNSVEAMVDKCRSIVEKLKSTSLGHL
ncbi:hypothetical protein Vadar_001725 [Vaccinium darrowii]|uniref:Uncharacterized protein n=1 Tax=Vaccinium darrowii TaxID=229202 RepID=A0ACB7WX40_9ERIC|nr:hypothetical protein Vadar_001725 [Vaccinium darrowii]